MVVENQVENGAGNFSPSPSPPEGVIGVITTTTQAEELPQEETTLQQDDGPTVLRLSAILVSDQEEIVKHAKEELKQVYEALELQERTLEDARRDQVETIDAIAVEAVNDVDESSSSAAENGRRSSPFYTKRKILLSVWVVMIVIVGTASGIWKNRRNKERTTTVNDGSGPSVSPETLPPPEVTSLADLLANEYGLDTEIMFADGTPQNRALFFMALEDEWTRGVLGKTTTTSEEEEEDLPPPIELIGERYGLAVLYYATGGDQWQIQVDWFVDSPASMCNWTDVFPRQVECNEDDSVILLNLGKVTPL